MIVDDFFIRSTDPNILDENINIRDLMESLETPNEDNQNLYVDGIGQFSIGTNIQNKL